MNNKKFIKFLLLCILAVCHNVIHAQGVHKWVDANGVTHFSSQPPSTSLAPVERYQLPRNTNVMAADSENSFVSLARLSASGLCANRRAAAQTSCVAEQIAAAREIGQLADRTTDPSARFAIQTCQQRHLLDRQRPTDFVAMRECIAQQ